MNILIDKKLESFLANHSSIHVVYHWDADGICAAAQVAKKYTVEKFWPCGNELTEEIVENIIESMPEAVLILDVGGLSPEKLDILKDTCDILIVDHHSQKIPLEGYPIIYEKDPVSVMIYNKLDGEEWIACCGARGDKTDDYCKKLFPKCNLALSRKVMGLLNAGKNFAGLDGAITALNAMISSQSIQDIIFKKNEWAKTLSDYDKQISVITSELINNHIKTAEIYRNEKILFYDLKNDVDLGSRIASILRWKYKQFIVFIYNSNLSPTPISMRTSRKDINLVDLLRKTELNNCGGHPDACGAKADIGQVISVKGKLLELLRE